VSRTRIWPSRSRTSYVSTEWRDQMSDSSIACSPTKVRKAYLGL
jgi:hypothetical protein